MSHGSGFVSRPQERTLPVWIADFLLCTSVLRSTTGIHVQTHLILFIYNIVPSLSSIYGNICSVGYCHCYSVIVLMLLNLGRREQNTFQHSLLELFSIFLRILTSFFGRKYQNFYVKLTILRRKNIRDPCESRCGSVCIHVLFELFLQMFTGSVCLI